MQKAVLIRETFTTQENLSSDSSNSAKAPTLCHRPPLYSWREVLPPHCLPPLFVKAKYGEIQTKSSINISCKKIKRAINSQKSIQTIS